VTGANRKELVMRKVKVLKFQDGHRMGCHMMDRQQYKRLIRGDLVLIAGHREIAYGNMVRRRMMFDPELENVWYYRCG